MRQLLLAPFVVWGPIPESVTLMIKPAGAATDGDRHADDAGRDGVVGSR